MSQQDKNSYILSDINNRINELTNINRANSDIQEFLESRMELGELFENLGLYDNAEECYREINKNDIGEYFVKSRNELGRLLYKQRKYKEAEKVYLEVVREDSPKYFAMLSVNLGILLTELNRYEEAKKIYQGVNKEDDKRQFAMARVNLGVLLVNQKKYREAERAFREIEREDNRYIFAMAKMNLGSLYKKLGKDREAEEAFLEVRKKDSKEHFAMAMYFLGDLLNKQKRYKEEEIVYRKIERNNNREFFAKSRNELGRLLDRQGKFEEAEGIYREAVRDDSPKDFSTICINLGILLTRLNKYEEAEKIYREVRREDDKRQYAKSRINLGVLLKEQKRYEEAEQIYKEVVREDDKSHFAMSQMNLGVLYADWGKYKEAEDAYLKVKREDDKKQFASARNNLGYLLHKQGRYKEAERAYLDVVRDDSPKDFARASVNLGVLLEKQKRYDEAIKILCKVEKDDNEYFFCRARFIIGNILIFRGKYEIALDCFRYSKKVHRYESESFIKILEFSNEFIELLIKLRENIFVILNCLKLDSKHEEYICHYTRPSTAFSLLGDLGDNKPPSNLRLSTIKNVNDPTEGKILFDYLDFPNKETGLGSFISCFTFNHDSLNQFRLYGKENNQEASGVSIVFNKEFFDEYSGFYNFIDYEGKELPVILSSLEGSLNEKNNKIRKLPVYRCIYMDQESDYIKLAKRNEIDFYRNGMSSKDFYDYLNEIDKKTEKVKQNLNEINNILKIIIRKNINDDICNAINYVLLPLRFLIKHAAFEDEQECRMFFITNLFDERIISNANEKSMYLKYEPTVREYINKIYLSIGASQYEDFFIKNLRDSSKVFRSRNPFKNK